MARSRRVEKIADIVCCDGVPVRIREDLWSGNWVSCIQDNKRLGMVFPPNQHELRSFQHGLVELLDLLK